MKSTFAGTYRKSAYSIGLPKLTTSSSSSRPVWAAIILALQDLFGVKSEEHALEVRSAQPFPSWPSPWKSECGNIFFKSFSARNLWTLGPSVGRFEVACVQPNPPGGLEFLVRPLGCIYVFKSAQVVTSWTKASAPWLDYFWVNLTAISLWSESYQLSERLWCTQIVWRHLGTGEDEISMWFQDQSIGCV